MAMILTQLQKKRVDQFARGQRFTGDLGAQKVAADRAERARYQLIVAKMMLRSMNRLES
jgi:hypothetical protein